jgi:hypothetical protein
MAGLAKHIKSFLLPPEQLPQDSLTHGMYFLICSVLVIAPFFLSCSDEPGAPVRIAGVSLPPSCPSKLVGLECPGCGMTHAFVLLTHGQIRESVRWHRLGTLLYAFFLTQVFFRACALCRPELRSNAHAAAFQYYTSSAIIVLLLGNWIATLFLGANGSTL